MEEDPEKARARMARLKKAGKVTGGCRNLESDAKQVGCLAGWPIEIEPAIFDLLSDGVSAILGPVWSKGCANLKAEVFNYAEETKTRPGKILQALWEKALQKTIQRNAGRHGAFSETEILFIALCQLSRDQEQEIGAAAQNILEAQERTVRILWENAPKPAISSCPSHQRKLEGSPARESSDAVRWMPSKTAHKASGNMQGLWGKQKTQDVSETFSKMEKIWRSVADKDIVGQRKWRIARVGVMTDSFPAINVIPWPRWIAARGWQRHSATGGGGVY
jgi:hypothetical protein